jgi:hypothetical protein
MLLGIPLTLTEDLQASAVQNDVNGPVMADSTRLASGEAAAAPLKVEWSGTAISNPNECRTERVKPSAWRSAGWMTSRSVSTASMTIPA